MKSSEQSEERTIGSQTKKNEWPEECLLSFLFLKITPNFPSQAQEGGEMERKETTQTTKPREVEDELSLGRRRRGEGLGMKGE